jgi:hypothetical protein
VRERCAAQNDARNVVTAQRSPAMNYLIYLVGLVVVVMVIVNVIT